MDLNDRDIAYFSKDYQLLEKILVDWGHRIQEFDAGKGISTLKIGIARKTPHLFRYLRRNHGIDIEDVTEIAVPFIDPTPYDGAIVADDAIYFGSTFQNVRQIIQSHFGQDKSVTGSPVVVAENANPALLEDFPKVTKIHKEDVPFYINSVIDIIQGGECPYDLEVPLFHLPESKPFNPSVFKSKIKERFGCDLDFYFTSRENNLTKAIDYGISFPLDDLYDQEGRGPHPDIAKLRIKLQNNRLCITSYCIFQIQEEDLDIDSPLFPKEVNEKIWNQLATIAKHNMQGGDQDWKYQVSKSLCVMANYLCSYLLFDSLKEEIQEAIGMDIDPSSLIHEDDLRLLVGPALAPWLKKSLGEIRIKRIKDFGKRDGKSPVKVALIPQAYNTDFKKAWTDEILARKMITADSVLTAQFGAMHRMVELRSRNAEAKSHRLRFGESMGALMQYTRVLARTGNQNSDHFTHKGLDARIDNGSVVPNYVRRKFFVEGQFDMPSIWLRLFRSGENDDAQRDQKLRNLLFVLNELNSNQIVPVPTAVFQMALTFLTLCGIKLTHPAISIDWDNRGYLTTLSDATFNDVIECMVIANVAEVDSNQRITIKSSAIADDLSTGNLLSQEEEESAKRLLNAFLKLYNTDRAQCSHIQNLISILNWDKEKEWMRRDMQSFIGLAKSVADKITEECRTDKEFYNNFHNLNSALGDILNRIPQILENEEKVIVENDPILHNLIPIQKSIACMAEGYKKFYPTAKLCFYAMVLFVAWYGVYSGDELPDTLKAKKGLKHVPNVSIAINGLSSNLHELITQPKANKLIKSLSAESAKEMVMGIFRQAENF